MYLESLRLGNKVIEVITTNNEFGTHHNEFKGPRLRRIRERELDKANQIFGKYSNNKVEVIRMGYIDGYLPLNKESIQKIINLIRKEKPTIVFAPDLWYAQDFHEDHLNTGRLVYFSLKRLKKSELPRKVLYYFSTKTRYYLKCRWKDFKIVKEALSQHQSQYTPLANKQIITFYSKLSIFRHLLEKRKFSESFRKQKFIDDSPIPPPKFEEMNFKQRLIYYTFSKVTIWGYKRLHNITPEELGLK